MQLRSQPPSMRRCRCPVSSHCCSAGAPAEHFGNSALLLSNTIPFHIKYTIPEGQLMYLSLKLAVQMFQWVKSDSTSIHVQRALQEQKKGTNSGLLWFWGKYLCFLRLVPKHKGFVGAISLLASLPPNCRERGLYCSSSHSRKSQ